MATCPFCQRGSLWVIAALTPEAVITRILRPLKLAAVPLPSGPPLPAKKCWLGCLLSCVASAPPMQCRAPCWPTTSKFPRVAPPGGPPLPRPAGPVQHRGAPAAVPWLSTPWRAPIPRGAAVRPAPAIPEPRAAPPMARGARSPAGPARRTPGCSGGCTPEDAVAQ